jgi:type I restriction enzyme S subunit
VSWKNVALGDVCKVIAGQSPESKNYNKEGIGLAFYQGKKDFGDVYVNPPNVWTTEITKEAIKNDILMSVRAPVGPVNIATEHICIGRGLAAIRATERINQAYLFYYLLKIEKELVGNAGAVFNSINKTQIENLLVPIPPIATQQKIVAKLDAIFTEIDIATAAAEANANNAEALYKSFLIDFFTKNIDDSKIFNLSDLCLTLHQGLNTAGEKVKFYDSGFPIIQTRNIDNGIIDVSDKLKFLSKEDWEKYKDKFKPEIGDVFFTNIGTIGKTAIVTNMEDYLIHWNIFKIRPKFNLITSKFMKLALDYLTLSDYFRDRQKGGTVEFVTKKMISEVSLSIPSLKIQIELTNKNDSIFEFCEILRESYLNKLNEIKRLKNSILQQAFSGELVKD